MYYLLPTLMVRYLNNLIRGSSTDSDNRMASRVENNVSPKKEET